MGHRYRITVNISPPLVASLSSSKLFYFCGNHRGTGLNGQLQIGTAQSLTTTSSVLSQRAEARSDFDQMCGSTGTQPILPSVWFNELSQASSWTIALSVFLLGVALMLVLNGAGLGAYAADADQDHCSGAIFLCGALSTPLQQCFDAADCKMATEMRTRIESSQDPIVTFMHQMVPHHLNVGCPCR